VRVGGNRFYDSSGVYTGPGQRGDVFLDYEDAYHLHGPGFDGVSGFDVVMLAAQNLATMKVQAESTEQFYANGMQFSGVLTSPRPLSDPRIASIRAEIEKKHRGQPSGFLILSGGMTWTQISATPRDAQSAEVYQAMLRDCCRWWGVPPHKIADMSAATFGNIEQQSIEFVRDGLTPWAERMAQEADGSCCRRSARTRRASISIGCRRATRTPRRNPTRPASTTGS
jgi:HK97 family phage portal protein